MSLVDFEAHLKHSAPGFRCYRCGDRTEESTFLARVKNEVVVADDCRWALHPYDGGMDVIAESPAARDRLRAMYSWWLSARPDGL
jgi:hypothetical protein